MSALPYEFDLLYDCKSLQDVVNELRRLHHQASYAKREYNDLYKMSIKAGLHLPEELPESI